MCIHHSRTQEDVLRKQLDIGLALNMLIAYCHCSCTGLRLMADWPVPEGLEGRCQEAAPGAGRPWARSQQRGACPQYQSDPEARAWTVACPPRAPRAAWLNPLLAGPDHGGCCSDLVEHDGLTLEQALARQLRDGRTEVRPHEGLLRWGAHGAARYLSAGSAADAQRGWAAEPVSRPWVMQVKPRDGGIIYELCAWGRRYESADEIPRIASCCVCPV